MPRKKKAETAEVKTEVIAEAVKAPVVEAPAEKPAKKVVEKKPVEKKAAEKKAAAKPKAEIKQTVKVQFGGVEFDIADIQKAVEADVKSKFKGKVKTLEVYVKPEDKAAYYVVNSDFSDKVEL